MNWLLMMFGIFYGKFPQHSISGSYIKSNHAMDITFNSIRGRPPDEVKIGVIIDYICNIL